MAEMLSKSQMVPKCYQGKPQDTLVAMMMGAELRLNPIQSLQNIAVINGKPSIYGDAMLALVQRHPVYGGHEESFDDATMTASCTVWRKGDEPHTQTFSQSDAKTALLWGKSGPWTQYPKRMLALRARGFALRNKFSDVLAGLISREEAEDMPVEKEVKGERVRPLQSASIAQPPNPKVNLDQINNLENALNVSGLEPAIFLERADIQALSDLPANRYKGALDWIKSQATKEENTNA